MTSSHHEKLSQQTCNIQHSSSMYQNILIVYINKQHSQNLSVQTFTNALGHFWTFVHALCTQKHDQHKQTRWVEYAAAILKQFNHMTTLKCYSTEILSRVGLLHTLQIDILLHITYEPHPMEVQHYNTSSTSTQSEICN